MNIYARIRKIEESEAFKRLIDTLLGAEYPHDFEPIKEWKDFGIDGYLKSEETVYAIYCPRYSERKSQDQYVKKIDSDLQKLKKTLDDKKVSFKVSKWCFVTPDDLSVGIKDRIKGLTESYGWKWGTLTAQSLAPIFMNHPEIQRDFPEIMSGVYFDKVPSIYVKFAKNRSYASLEIFNNGTEGIQDLEVFTKSDGATWVDRSEGFYYDFDNPARDSKHSCFTLKKGERQYIADVPQFEGFFYKVSGVGVESRKTFIFEEYIEERSPT